MCALARALALARRGLKLWNVSTNTKSGMQVQVHPLPPHQSAKPEDLKIRLVKENQPFCQCGTEQRYQHSGQYSEGERTVLCETDQLYQRSVQYSIGVKEKALFCQCGAGLWYQWPVQYNTVSPIHRYRSCAQIPKTKEVFCGPPQSVCACLKTFACVCQSERTSG